MVDITPMSPADIENKSFEIIRGLLKEQGLELTGPCPGSGSNAENLGDDRGTGSGYALEWDIICRCIHTTADTEFARTMRFSKDAVDIIQKLIREGADIVTDTNMALTGISKKKLESYGGSVHCFMADTDVAKEASERGVTRAYVAMEKAARIYGTRAGASAQTDAAMQTGAAAQAEASQTDAALCKPVIFAVGNAPTALVSLHNLKQAGIFTPSFVIGVPVGFVNVAASKELIMSDDIPYIVNEGNKGGSPVAAAIINAVLKHMDLQQ